MLIKFSTFSHRQIKIISINTFFFICWTRKRSEKKFKWASLNAEMRLKFNFSKKFADFCLPQCSFFSFFFLSGGGIGGETQIFVGFCFALKDFIRKISLFDSLHLCLRQNRGFEPPWILYRRHRKEKEDPNVLKEQIKSTNYRSAFDELIFHPTSTNHPLKPRLHDTNNLSSTLIPIGFCEN